MKNFIAFIMIIAILFAIHFGPPINSNKYKIEPVDYGTLNEYEQEVFDEILLCVQQGKRIITYDKSKLSETKILTHLGLYYGTMESVYELIGWGLGYFVLNLEKFEEFEDNKLVVEARIDEALFNIYEGTDQYKLIQIANYISDRMVYNPGVRETIDGLNGQGVCATYSMLFYKMATRLGIQTYICYGYTSSFYHCWNMVELNGKQYFYDIAWFDGRIYNYAYIQSEDCWERKYALNDLWEGAY